MRSRQFTYLLPQSSVSFLKACLVSAAVVSAITACAPVKEEPVSMHNGQVQSLSPMPHFAQGEGKPVVYQVFTRLFGNTNTTNKAWGTIAENGIGKFSDFDDTALQSIKALGASYVWYTGVPHHAVINDYSEYGISLDDPDVVKGRAGSPYAVKDYYNVNPDLADDPAKRLQEFEALIVRTHANGMKVIIDIVPNHVARQYESISRPEGVANFGENDNVGVEYARNNNFYYIQNQSFATPAVDSTRVLGGEAHPMADASFTEHPAKWTGNGSRLAQPDANDWYETVKVNYGVKPDGSYDFERLPEDYREQGVQAHAAFWQGKSVPDSWQKFHDIVHYWLDKGVDGFRYDMAEMVPVEFWSYLNSSTKVKNPEAFLLAEVYNPSLYRDYLQLGKMDYLYDKVEFYDALKLVMQGKGPAQPLEDIQTNLADIEAHMLHFLENHDEQRIASPEFAGDANKGLPALVVSALISRSPTMLYFGQDVGEDGSEEPGFGAPSRTSIFDYIGVPAHQRYMNKGAFDGGQSTDSEKALRAYYETVMQISANHPSMNGAYESLHSFNIAQANSQYSESQFSFVRYTDTEALLVVNNFSEMPVQFDLALPVSLLSKWQLNEGTYTSIDLLSDTQHSLRVAKKRSSANVSVSLTGLESVVLSLSLTQD